MRNKVVRRGFKRRPRVVVRCCLQSRGTHCVQPLLLCQPVPSQRGQHGPTFSGLQPQPLLLSRLLPLLPGAYSTACHRLTSCYCLSSAARQVFLAVDAVHALGHRAQTQIIPSFLVYRGFLSASSALGSTNQHLFGNMDFLVARTAPQPHVPSQVTDTKPAVNTRAGPCSHSEKTHRPN
jgi:hypothetical protein